jgi:excisionase family DNA binding protein
MDRLLTRRQLAQILGLAVATVSDPRWARKNQLPVMRIGGRVRIAPKTLSRWIAGRVTR